MPRFHLCIFLAAIAFIAPSSVDADEIDHRALLSGRSGTLEALCDLVVSTFEQQDSSLLRCALTLSVLSGFRILEAAGTSIELEHYMLVDVREAPTLRVVTVLESLDTPGMGYHYESFRFERAVRRRLGHKTLVALTTRSDLVDFDPGVLEELGRVRTRVTLCISEDAHLRDLRCPLRFATKSTGAAWHLRETRDPHPRGNWPYVRAQRQHAWRFVATYSVRPDGVVRVARRTERWPDEDEMFEETSPVVTRTLF